MTSIALSYVPTEKLEKYASQILLIKVLVLFLITASLVETMLEPLHKFSDEQMLPDGLLKITSLLKYILGLDFLKCDNVGQGACLEVPSY